MTSIPNIHHINELKCKWKCSFYYHIIQVFFSRICVTFNFHLQVALSSHSSIIIVVVVIVVVSKRNVIYAATSLFLVVHQLTTFLSLCSLPRGLFLSIGNYHITCYYRIVSSNRGDKLSGFVRLCVHVIHSHHAKCARFNRTCFHFDLNTHTLSHTLSHTQSRHDNQQTAHRHRNLSLLRSIASTMCCMCLHEKHLSTEQRHISNGEDARASPTKKRK